MRWVSACQLLVSVFYMKHMISDDFVQAGGVSASPVVDVVGGDDQMSDVDSNDDGAMMAGTRIVGSGMPRIFTREVDPIVYERYIGHVRDAIRISRQGYWNSDLPSPYRIESRTARHGDAWRTRSFTKVEIECGAVWIVL